MEGQNTTRCIRLMGSTPGCDRAPRPFEGIPSKLSEIGLTISPFQTRSDVLRTTAWRESLRGSKTGGREPHHGRVKPSLDNGGQVSMLTRSAFHRPLPGSRRTTLRYSAKPARIKEVPSVIRTPVGSPLDPAVTRQNTAIKRPSGRVLLLLGVQLI